MFIWSGCITGKRLDIKEKIESLLSMIGISGTQDAYKHSMVACPKFGQALSWDISRITHYTQQQFSSSFIIVVQLFFTCTN